MLPVVLSRESLRFYRYGAVLTSSRTLSNPNASDEAKESAKDRLNKMGE